MSARTMAERAQRAIAECRRIADLSEEPDRTTRRFLTPPVREVHQLLTGAGFEVVRLETGPFRELPRPELAWVRRLLERHWLTGELRDEGIYAVGRKSGPVRERYPEWLYA